ncbi:MAG: insulinase family protein [Chitinophagales bacterium]|nr:insulinase family protein [Bacteroidota bacterium]MBK8682171.1 insulinase family protein [Bacteroidota bacterium]MBP7399059.1 insulinase family protein [Chitinophagales bacterium]MBP9188401.1 insulinase family protein [Chitinophagales bacterium]MBP9703433.1 insulinase family protein [Chitinophagales bacterium]
MKNYFAFLLFALCCNIAIAQQNTTYPTIDIPYKIYTLDNGLTLIVSEDHKVPMVSFDIWYHVGSKNEKPGKTGFAHLFEHIMFTGAEHYPDFDKVMQTVGGGSNNGTTNSDRTNFYENFTPSGLDRVLWLESDRMGFLLNGLDSANIEVQRGVVQNEKRQRENQPYAIAYELSVINTYPQNHPYSHTVIGSMDDLSAATVEDIKDWFREYYGPNNATISICGDVNADEVFEKVKKYFGEIPASVPLVKQGEWIAKMNGTHTVIAQDRVAQPLLQKTWNIPAWGSKEGAYLDLLSTVLTNGASSRLYKRLITDEELCSEIWSYTNGQEIGQQIEIGAFVNDENDIDKVNAIIDEELMKIFTNGVTENELHLAKTNYFSYIIKSLERIDSKSDMLAENQVFGGSPDYYKTYQDYIRNATPADLKNAANMWLKDGEFILKIIPYPDYTTSDVILDRTKMPEVGTITSMKFPEIKTLTLSNGVNVYLIERHETPIVNMSVLFNVGYETDELSKAGTSRLMTDLLLKGTTTKTAEQINNNINALGADLYTTNGLEKTKINLVALKNNFKQSVDLLSDVLINANFPTSEFDRLKKEQIIAIEQESANPNQLASRVLPQLMYGKSVANGLPSSGSGYKETVASITKEDVVNHFQKNLGYKNATIFVVGDITESELKPILEKSLSNWKAGDKANKVTLAKPELKTSKIYFIDMPGAQQSVIRAAELFVVEKNIEKNEAMEMMNTLLGGSFLSRLNMNLREDKHWSYGAGSFFSNTKQQSQYTIYTSVQTDKTKESLIEILKELTAINKKNVITDSEFKQQQAATLMELPGNYEANSDLSYNLEDVIFYDKGLSYLNNISTTIQALTLTNVHAAAEQYITPKNLTWLVIGDKSKVYEGLKELDWGEVIELDKNGEVVK